VTLRLWAGMFGTFRRSRMSAVEGNMTRLPHKKWAGTTPAHHYFDMEWSPLGNIARSWVGHGANEPIRPADLERALGPEKIAWLARETGMSREQLFDGLSRELPNAIWRDQHGTRITPENPRIIFFSLPRATGHRCQLLGPHLVLRRSAEKKFSA